MTKEQSHALARAYFDAVSKGDLPDHLLTPDMTGWITASGAMSNCMDKAAYQRLVRILGAMLAEPLVFTIHSLTAEEDRVVAEAESVGTLINGEVYRQTYVFVLRVRDGRIASVAEHYNMKVSQDSLVPLMAAAIAKVNAQTA